MPTAKSKIDFLASEQGVESRQVLIDLVEDPRYNTLASYSANTILYPDNKIPFVEKHMQYLSDHLATNPQQYISNLRLLTRIR